MVTSSFSDRNRDSIHNVASQVFIPHHVWKFLNFRLCISTDHVDVASGNSILSTS